LRLPHRCSRGTHCCIAKSRPRFFRTAESEGIGVIVYSPMASGLLTGAMNRDRIASLPKDDWRKGHSDFNEPNLSRHLALVDHLKEIARRRGGSAGEVALASDNA